jgi:LCP family protein required for cell wall assembly
VPKKKAVFLGLAGFALVSCVIAAFFLARIAFFIHRVAPAAALTEVVGIARKDKVQIAGRDEHLGRLDFLLLGYGGPGHDGPYLTDSIMVISAQTETHQLAMISIPRDLWIPIPTNRNGLNWTTKINAAYKVGILDELFPYKDPHYRGPLGAGNLATEMVRRVTGLPIQYWVAMDFDGFRTVVNSVGGVDIDVPRALDDWEYPDDRTNGYMHVHLNAGRQHMDGERALQFARLRHTEGGDFDRSRRQQLILLAVRRKVFTLGGIPKMLGLMDALQDHVRTNMNLQQIRKFADVIDRLQDTQPVRVSVDDTNFLYDAVSSDGQDILVSYDPAYGGLQHFLQQLFADPEIGVEAASVQFLNGTYAYGLRHGTMAAMLGQLWGSAGFQVMPPGETSRKDYVRCEVHDYSRGQATVTVRFLASFFDADIVTESKPSPNGGAVAVIIGRDCARSMIPERSGFPAGSTLGGSQARR